jgi:hypothetical protein
LPQGAIPTFHVIGLSTSFAKAFMSFFREDNLISFLKIAVTLTTLVVGRNLLFLCLSVAAFWLQYTMFAAVLTPVLLAATRIVAILDNILTIAFSTFVDHQFWYHKLAISQITSSCPLSKIFIAHFLPDCR